MYSSLSLSMYIYIYIYPYNMFIMPIKRQADDHPPSARQATRRICARV